ncbi:MAG TPA: YbaK/EbsC family protein [Gaiellales bacterium]|nr:YbaK/EbsC family protein [Gaiellales bacterium]
MSRPAAPNSRERVRNALRAAGLDCDIVETPDSARTAVEAAAAVGSSVGQIVKSLVFMCDDRPVLALVAGDNRLDEARLAELAGGDISRADAARVREYTGFAIGGVAPLGLLEPLPVYCDADLLKHEYVWASAGAPHAVFRVEPRALADAAGAQVAELALR